MTHPSASRNHPPGASIPTVPTRTIEQLDILTEEFAVLQNRIRLDLLLVSGSSPQAPAARYRTAQGLAAAALQLLLDLAEEPYARSNADGREAVADLGRLTKAATEATVRIAGAAALAVEAHRTASETLPSWKKSILNQHLAAANERLQHAAAMCRSAAAFIRSATAHLDPAVPADKELVGTAEQSIAGTPAVALAPAQQQALRLVDAATVTLFQVPREHPMTGAGGPKALVTRSVNVTIPQRPRNPTSRTALLPGDITTQVVDQLVEMGLVRCDTRTSLYVGQRLHTTTAGRRMLNRLGSAPAPPPSPPRRGVPRIR